LLLFSNSFNAAATFSSRWAMGWPIVWVNLPTPRLPSADEADLDPISLVCRLMTVAGRSTVKLSDNVRKATGSVEERRVFGSVAVGGAAVVA
jgi:nicotinate phosphoribosyltransferase